MLTSTSSTRLRRSLVLFRHEEKCAEASVVLATFSTSTVVAACSSREKISLGVRKRRLTHTQSTHTHKWRQQQLPQRWRKAARSFQSVRLSVAAAAHAYTCACARVVALKVIRLGRATCVTSVLRCLIIERALHARPSARRHGGEQRRRRGGWAGCGATESRKCGTPKEAGVEWSACTGQSESDRIRLDSTRLERREQRATVGRRPETRERETESNERGVLVSVTKSDGWRRSRVSAAVSLLLVMRVRLRPYPSSLRSVVADGRCGGGMDERKERKSADPRPFLIPLTRTDTAPHHRLVSTNQARREPLRLLPAPLPPPPLARCSCWWCSRTRSASRRTSCTRSCERPCTITSIKNMQIR